MADEQFTLHEMHISGNCYKIRLVASLLGLKLNLIEYDLLKGETQTPHYKDNINPTGKLPVLQIGQNTCLPESGAACFYLASTTNPRRRLIPEDRLQHAQMLQWMFFEQYTHEPAVAVLRFWRMMVGKENLSEMQRQQMPGKEEQARKALNVMESHLETEGRKWFVGDDVTLADIALFAYTHCMGDGGLNLEEWPTVGKWVERVRALQGFVALED